ncbi:lytic transglycosylase domain-containing protein [Agrobacterium tumefaciens]|uniref:lytic transglycosylase domain-containing protein n=1 Tax=Agrobacterium tumefaciens TaxID=358 RepID=UPI0015722D79|nr:lytic transglycosylase domain-containing protein [Agrobacterium tumefaciens]NTE37654.1 lytic transglycosylase domain-containing protein [Agrobacterium tumefaciens]NTE53166.1 lytic transglycosylase domain-containing protein [Agrobacterium tumefaciens]
MRNRFAILICSCAIVLAQQAYARDAKTSRLPAPAKIEREALVEVSASSPAVVKTQTCSETRQDEIAALVRQIASEEDFDADLAEAVAWAESNLGGNQGPSAAGALGVMQLMPGTASDLGVTDRCDARSNIRAGIRFLKSLHAEFKDPLLMLAAYNAGPRTVQRADGIPLNNETTKYVAKILNRWKLRKAIRTEPGEVQPVSAAVAKPTPKPAVETVSWQDGHVIDFQ